MSEVEASINRRGRFVYRVRLYRGGHPFLYLSGNHYAIGFRHATRVARKKKARRERLEARRSQSWTLL